MRIFIELPTWLGDAVMASPAIEMIYRKEHEPDLVFFGSKVAVDLYSSHPGMKEKYYDNTRDGNRFSNIRTIAGKSGHFDKAFTFRNSFWSGMLMRCLDADISVGRSKGLRNFFIDRTYQWKENSHQVERYFEIVSSYYRSPEKAGPLVLYHSAKVPDKPTVGINPGAAYGSAKRWKTKGFGEVAISLSDKFDILLFGGPSEKDQCQEISEIISSAGVKNFRDLSGQTTVPELVSYIAGLSGFITNDSGPMHIAAAYQIPTVTIFGPTDYISTSQWKNKYSAIVSSGADCAPCMRRRCPEAHHKCMEDVTSDMVLRAFDNIRKKVENLPV